MTLPDLGFSDLVAMVASIPKPEPLPLLVVGSEYDRLRLESFLPRPIPDGLILVCGGLKEGDMYAVDRKLLEPPKIELNWRPEPYIPKRWKHVRRLRTSPRGRRIAGKVLVKIKEFHGR